MNKLKKIIIFLLVLIIILVVLIIISSQSLKKADPSWYIDGIGLREEDIDYSTTYPVKDSTVLYTVEACIQKYIKCLYSETDNKVNDEILYNLLSANYIKKSNINKDNVKDVVNIFNKKVNFIAKKVNSFRLENINQYSVYGIIEDAKTEEIIGELYFKVILDVKNRTFSIEPIADCSSVEEIKVEKGIKKIDKNDNNGYKYVKNRRKNSNNEYEYISL